MRVPLFPDRAAVPAPVSAWLSSRRHIDLRRVNSAGCTAA